MEGQTQAPLNISVNSLYGMMVSICPPTEREQVFCFGYDGESNHNCECSESVNGMPPHSYVPIPSHRHYGLYVQRMPPCYDISDTVPAHLLCKPSASV